MGDLSAHFSRSEFRDRRTGVVKIDPALVPKLERLRAIVGGKPMRIVSAYRSASTNKLVGGAKQSQHLRGAAVDLEVGYCTTAQAEAAGFTGIGSKGVWATHVDVRPGTRVAHWRY